MRDHQETIRRLEAKARDEVVTAPEREAIHAKIAALRQRYPEPVAPQPPTISVLAFWTTSNTDFTPGPMKMPKRKASSTHTSSFSFGASEGTAFFEEQDDE